jgi:nucleoside-diphosphate-sugar epimerase
MVEGGHWNRVVNLAAGHPLTIEALVREVGAILGTKALRIEKEGVANESNQFWGSTSEMQKFFDFVPQVTLAEGIERLRKFLELDRN